MIACIAVVGKKNELLYLKPFLAQPDASSDYFLSFHFIAHSALDAFDERSKSVSRRPSPSFPSPASTNDMFLGYLCPIEEFRVYGYKTSTQIKFLAILTENNPVRENDLKSVFQGLHILYVSYLQSPFSPLTGKITSERFSKGVERQVVVYNQSISSNSAHEGGGGLATLSSSRLLPSTSSISASFSSSLTSGT
ncbi:trafficking protein particle complex subunit 2-like protein [Nannochloropsis gaditana]|uniref:Trafficking protein particle complex subunit 2-like protein n=1 Tax=Nannochloropsis gaditana TaxID=72520 RepID=W7T3S0_9STRA|nr:trafficking protein particle complex subunit 2-like protein [Nannochloropsis gaditana]